MRKSKTISAAKLGKILSKVDTQIDLLQTAGVFPKTVTCSCDNIIENYSLHKDRIVFKCDVCYKKNNIRKNTILERSKIR